MQHRTEAIKRKTVVAHILTKRYLERIADHSSYISESLNPAITGKRISLR